MKAVTHETTKEQLIDPAALDQAPEIPYYASFADRAIAPSAVDFNTQ